MAIAISYLKSKTPLLLSLPKSLELRLYISRHLGAHTTSLRSSHSASNSPPPPIPKSQSRALSILAAKSGPRTEWASLMEVAKQEGSSNVEVCCWNMTWCQLADTDREFEIFFMVKVMHHEELAE
ncbi:PREDICTED: uncharacterized protein LOC103319288 [Prunus mume]|uniref:Uncharacterized protein LOC103319288 n=1 Tax=Prunus mume TaxID=102107 RepID=A0ABM1LJ23_PRUMU|nr:PREDICTED: uncharacterized protein LOC103319288 [Prunus mume]